MADYLFDPASAQYRNLRAGRQGAVCGRYNAKNRYGAYVGFKDFVLLKDNKTLYASERNDGVEVEVFGAFADAYIRLCADKDERVRHAEATAPILDDYTDVVEDTSENITELDVNEIIGNSISE